mgnify:FL=1
MRKIDLHLQLIEINPNEWLFNVNYKSYSSYTDLCKMFDEFLNDPNVDNLLKEAFINSAIDRIFKHGDNEQSLKFLRGIRQMMSDEFDECDSFLQDLNKI